MSLIVVVQNDGTGSDEAANYNYRILINTRQIASGHVAAHNRKHGWRELIRRVLEEESHLSPEPLDRWTSEQSKGTNKE